MPEIALGLRLDEDVAQVGGLLHVQTDGPVDAAVGQKIDLPAEGRNVQVLPLSHRTATTFFWPSSSDSVRSTVKAV